MDCLTKSRPKLKLMYTTSSSKGCASLTDSRGQSEDKGVVPLIPLSIGSSCCSNGFGQDTGGDPTVTPSEKNK